MELHNSKDKTKILKLPRIGIGRIIRGRETDYLEEILTGKESDFPSISENNEATSSKF